MLSRIILAVVAGVVAYLVCFVVGTLLLTTGVGIADAVGALLKTFAALISVLVFLYYAFVGTPPVHL